ncbi:methionine/alanine import family NSS transporter small subunit [Bacillaceae bacterium W0354]
MSFPAIVMMIVGMGIIWGGLGVSIYMAVKRSNQN